MDARTNLWALVAIILTIGVIFWAIPGRCAYCYPYECLNSSTCGQNCICAKLGGGISGVCVSVD